MAPESIQHRTSRRVARLRSTRVVRLSEDVYQSWRSDRTVRLGAGLAYYALFAIVPFLSLSVAIASFVFKRNEVQSFVADSLTRLLGANEADLIAQAVATELGSSAVGKSLGLVGIATLVIASALLLAALQDALNVIFGVPVEVGIRRTVRRRLTLFVLVLALASVVLVSLVLNAALAAIVGLLGLDNSIVVGATLSLVGRIGSTVLIVVGLAVLYRFLPRTSVPWNAAIIGAIAATVTGWVVSLAVGFYLSRFATSSLEGAAGALALILSLIYILSQVALGGAQLTKTLARKD